MYSNRFGISHFQKYASSSGWSNEKERDRCLSSMLFSGRMVRVAWEVKTQSYPLRYSFREAHVSTADSLKIGIGETG